MTYQSNTANGKKSSHAGHFLKIEHWLTDEEKAKLERALKPYIGRVPGNDLGGIMRRNFPPRILTQLHQVVEEPETPVLHIIHNLPNTPNTVIQKTNALLSQLPNQVDDKEYWSSWAKRRTIEGVITDGICQALGMKEIKPDAVIRRFSDATVRAACLHRDGKWHVTALAGMLSDGSKTRYVDWLTVLAEAMESQLSSMRFVVKSASITKEMSVCELEKLYQKEPLNNVTIEGISPQASEAERCAFGEIVKRYSYDVMIGPGDMVVSGNRGRVFHQAMKNSHASAGKGVSRILVAHIGCPYSGKPGYSV